MVCLHIITGSLNQSRFSIPNENLNTIHVHDKLTSCTKSLMFSAILAFNTNIKITIKRTCNFPILIDLIFISVIMNVNYVLNFVPVQNFDPHLHIPNQPFNRFEFSIKNEKWNELYPK